jgi:mono/diheme cytochrome c family protein
VRVAPIALVAAVLGAAACGSGGGGGHVAAPRAFGDVRLGQTVFAANCTACHSLTGIGPRRPMGGDLTGYRMSPAQVLLLTRSMPPAEHLSEHELRAVAAYVAGVEARASR